MTTEQIKIASQMRTNGVSYAHIGGVLGFSASTIHRGLNPDSASFDLTDRKQFLEARHYTNLQPLWAADNISKGDKFIGVV